MNHVKCDINTTTNVVAFQSYKYAILNKPIIDINP